MTSWKSLVRVILADRHFRFELISHRLFEKERVINKSELFAFDWRNILAEVLKSPAIQGQLSRISLLFKLLFDPAIKRENNNNKKKLEILSAYSARTCNFS